MEQFFLYRQYYFLAFELWWMRVTISSGIHHFLTVTFSSLVTVFIFFPLFFFSMDEESRQSDPQLS